MPLISYAAPVLPEMMLFLMLRCHNFTNRRRKILRSESILKRQIPGDSFTL